MGFQHDAEAGLYYRAADVYLHPARADTFPNVVLEALASGTPVVATSVGGIPEQLRPETGILVRPGAPAALAQALVTYLSDPHLQAQSAPRRQKMQRNDSTRSGMRLHIWSGTRRSSKSGNVTSQHRQPRRRRAGAREMSDPNSRQARLRRYAGTAAWPVLRLKRPQQPPPRGSVRFGSLRRTEPVSRKFGFDRGQGLDRYYIERFLKRHATDLPAPSSSLETIRLPRNWWLGRRRSDCHRFVDILHVTGENVHTTIVADLTKGEGLEDESFDCIICVQTLQFIYG